MSQGFSSSFSTHTHTNSSSFMVSCVTWPFFHSHAHAIEFLSIFSLLLTLLFLFIVVWFTCDTYSQLHHTVTCVIDPFIRVLSSWKSKCDGSHGSLSPLPLLLLLPPLLSFRGKSESNHHFFISFSFSPVIIQLYFHLVISRLCYSQLTQPLCVRTLLLNFLFSFHSK